MMSEERLKEGGGGFQCRAHARAHVRTNICIKLLGCDFTRVTTTQRIYHIYLCIRLRVSCT